VAGSAGIAAASETAVPIVLACHKSHVDLAARAFQLFAECAQYAKQAVSNMKVVPLASVLLVTNMIRIGFGFVIISFLWACATSGLIPQLKAVDKGLPNVMIAVINGFAFTILSRTCKCKPAITFWEPAA
jgi:hypothetical protein